MLSFDLGLLIALCVVALIFRTKAAAFLVAEKAASLVLIAILAPMVTPEAFHIVFAYLGFVFAYIIHRHLPKYNLLKLTAIFLAGVHASVVVSYYLLPYSAYLTVYNAYPKLYLVLVALQTIGVADGNDRIGAIVRGPLCAGAVYLLINFFYRTSYQRVKTK